MDNTISADNSTVTGTNNPASGELVSESVGTGNDGGQAGGASPAEATPAELFQGIDPKKLPPQVKPYYDSMLKDYRDKTAKLSDTIKSELSQQIKAYEDKASLYDQIASQEEFVNQWNDYVQKAQGQIQQTPNGNEGGSEHPAIAELKNQLQEINQKIQVAEMTTIAESFAQAVNEKGEKMHPDFDRLNEMAIGQVGNGKDSSSFSLLRACVELAQGATPQERLAQGYKSAKSVYDAIFEEGKKAGMGRLQTKSLNSTLPPSGANSSDVLSVTDKKPKNAREAMELARRGVLVSRD